jgi:hypothetical protein
MNSRIAGVGFVTVSLRRSIIGSAMFVLQVSCVPAYRKLQAKIKNFKSRNQKYFQFVARH